MRKSGLSLAQELSLSFVLETSLTSAVIVHHANQLFARMGEQTSATHWPSDRSPCSRVEHRVQLLPSDRFRPSITFHRVSRWNHQNRKLSNEDTTTSPARETLNSKSVSSKDQSIPLETVVRPIGAIQRL